MIVRSWHGIVPIEKAAGFREYLNKTGIAETKAIPGNLGAYMYSLPQDSYEHFFMVSYWRDYAAIRAFAGPQPQIAVTYPEDNKYSLISDPIVLHHEVSSVPNQFPLEPDHK